MNLFSLMALQSPTLPKSISPLSVCTDREHGTMISPCCWEFHDRQKNKKSIFWFCRGLTTTSVPVLCKKGNMDDIPKPLKLQPGEGSHGLVDTRTTFIYKQLNEGRRRIFFILTIFIEQGKEICCLCQLLRSLVVAANRTVDGIPHHIVRWEVRSSGGGGRRSA